MCCPIRSALGMKRPLRDAGSDPEALSLSFQVQGDTPQALREFWTTA